MTTGAYYLKRGDTFDIEDHRMTHRLGVARSILRSFGVEPTWPDHATDCMNHADNRYRRCFGVNYPCLGDCPRRLNPPATWPEWVTDEVFDLAFRLADEVQNSRGGWHQDQINQARAEREARERAARIAPEDQAWDYGPVPDRPLAGNE